MPSGLTINTGGVLSGTPLQSGSCAPTILVTDGNGHTSTASYTLVINATGTLTRAKKADFDGEGKTDFAVWRATTATWYVLKSSDGVYLIQALGANSDTQVPAREY